MEGVDNIADPVNPPWNFLQGTRNFHFGMEHNCGEFEHLRSLVREEFARGR